jgi:hypothetical protein
MILMTNIQQVSHYNVSLRARSNTQYVFSLFSCQCIRFGYVLDGDILLIDNASVYNGEETFGSIQHIGKSWFHFALATSIVHIFCLSQEQSQISYRFLFPSLE